MSIGKHAAQLTATMIAGQVVQLATLPLVAVFAHPADFGTYTFFVGVCAVLSIFAGLRYETAIIVARSRRRARVAATLVAALGGVTAAVVGTIALLAQHWVPTVGGEPLWILAILAMAYLMCNTLVRAVTSWLNRLARFDWVGGVQFAAVAGTVAIQIPLLVLGVRPAIALCGGFAAGQMVGVVVGLCGPARFALDLRALDFGRLLATGRHFSAFPRYMILYGLSSTLRERAIQALVGWGAGASALGQFAMAQRLMGAPNAFVYGGLGPSLLSHARRSERNDAAGVACALIEYAALLLSPVFVFVAVNSEPLVERFFQASWAGTHLYVWLLAPAYLALACTAFLDRLFELYGQQRVALQVDLAYSFIIVGALAVAAQSGSGTVLAGVFSIVFCIYEFAWTYTAFRTNALPTAGLRRIILFSALYIPGLVVLDTGLMVFESLAARAGIAMLASLFAFALHWRWLGGRRLLAKLIRT